MSVIKAVAISFHKLMAAAAVYTLVYFPKLFCMMSALTLSKASVKSELVLCMSCQAKSYFFECMF